jgi:hypothetical protein
MNYYCVASVGDGDSYWVQACSEEEARRVVARNVGEAGDAEDPARFSCTIDDSKKPPAYLAFRRLSYPAPVERR